MKEKRVEKQTFDHHTSGFNCAEAVAMTIIKEYSGQLPAYIPQIASGFGGGVGGTKDDLCGAISGAVLAIGFLYGRNKPGQEIDTVKDLSSEIRRIFIEEYGSTKCSDIIQKIESAPEEKTCKHVSSFAAATLCRLIENSDKQ